MEQIQQGLEAFLEKELDIIDTSERGRRKEGPDDLAYRERRRDGNPIYGNRSRREANRDYRDREPETDDWGYENREPETEGWDYRNREPEAEGWDYRNREPEAEDWDHRNRELKAGDWDYRNREPEAEGWDYRNREPEAEDWDYEEPTYRREKRTNIRPIPGSNTSAGRKPAQKTVYAEPEFQKEEPGKKKKQSKTRKQIPQEDAQMAKKSSKSSKAQKKKKKKFRLVKFLIIAAVLVALVGAGLYQVVGVVYGKMNYQEIASVTGESMQEDGVVNILLIGNDSRENGTDGRSDAMILLSISSKTKTIYMTSLLRDIYVEIPGYDNNRLNAAYSFGGAELLMETVEKNFDIPVNRYMLVNFEGFANLVDTVGGIELELTTEEIEYVNGYLVEYNNLTNRPQGTDNMDTSVSGLVHLNGPQALAYSRNRYIGTDFGRTDRQRKVLTAVIKKVPSVMLTNAGELMDGLLPNLTTNLTQYECFRLSLMAGKLLTYDIVSDSIPQPGTYSDATIREMAVLEVDFDTNIRYLKEKIYGE
ncbi:MAG: hypothetical protein HFH87_00740 [Lachnospiraceae bacterium]|nr:hypothetical protein [Lachnospiraceae bacterium]